MSDIRKALEALRRLMPAIEKGMGGLVFTADKAGEIAADMNALHEALSQQQAAQPASTLQHQMYKGLELAKMVQRGQMKLAQATPPTEPQAAQQLPLDSSSQGSGGPLYIKPQAAQPLQECADNDSPWLVCKTCAATGKCAQAAQPEAVAQAQIEAANWKRWCEEAERTFAGNALSWAVDRWNDEVKYRPLVNKNRRALDDTWRRVMRRFGGDPDQLVGPSHDALLAAPHTEPAPQAEPAAAPNEVAWLIESRFTGSSVTWWNGLPEGAGVSYTSDPNAAVRFSRKEDAERVAQFMHMVKVTEHVWM